MENQDICMETTHGRRGKTKTSFKGVLNKVLVSGLILATVAGMGVPAFAAELSIKDQMNQLNDSSVSESVTTISVSSAISTLRNTISTINQMKTNGSVSESALKSLASQLYQLEKSVKSNGGSVSSDIVSIINDAEKSISGVSNSTEVTVALGIVKDSLGIATVTATNKSASISSFGDVPTGYWAHDAIIAMSQKGLINGTKAVDANGVGAFSPDSTMTRSQFIIIVMRELFPTELKQAEDADATDEWWVAGYNLALQKGILTSGEFSFDVMSQGMTRQEMAMVLVRAADKKGEAPTQLIDTGRIADYDSVGTYYRDYVVKAYSMGMLCGTDDKGTYNPKGTLNRAQAATVLYRLVEPSARQEVDFTAPVVPPVSGPITIYEGQRRHNRLAQVGDTVIKADGTKVVLALGKDGVLGQDQGVAPDLGFSVNSNNNSGYVVENHTVFIGDGYKNSLGQSVVNDTYDINPYTGMGAWGLEWNTILKAHPKPDADGTKDGELSSDSYWVWSGTTNRWMAACNR